ncbi:hypothetical protein A0J61_00364 [Choanephora cucurbitarum]|uniref:DUF7905 domain-containing protein n=1 Tax=Choanephora cucurbitarum TaxID=101091 RepID=A0A1C7NVQ4_9FUNG|nr:hypothetical protein A0J61_00364 [Choanephora cucurbitarum]
MSIEPEVPYNFEDDEASDNEDGWRDAGVRSVQNTPQRPLVDVYIPNTRSDTPVSRASTRTFTDTTVVSEAAHRNADDAWILPAYCNPSDILGGPNKSRAKEIQRESKSYIEYNAEYNQIDIWGDADAIAKTKQYLDSIAHRLAENDTRTTRKTKKWGRPERELTEKEKRRAERRQAKLDEERRYQGLPAVPQNYNAVFPLPDTHLPLNHFMGDRGEEYFNAIRADCKAFLWYQETGNLVRISADTDESVREAGKRVRNWYLRCNRKPIGSRHRLLQQPTKPWVLRYRKLPQNFVTYIYDSPEGENHMLEKQRLLEPVGHGVPRAISNIQGQPEISLIDVNDSYENELPEHIRRLDAQNEKHIEKSLADGIESLRLNDWMIRMKIRFGSICLIDYPKKQDYLSIDYITDMFRKPRFNSALAPCIGKSEEHLGHLFDFLSNDSEAVEFSENPRTSFIIHAQQYPTAAPPRIPGQREPSRGDMWNTVMRVSFTESGVRKLWNTMTDCHDLVDINCLDIEGNYSWDLKLQYARQLPNNDFDTPHSKFWQALSITPEKRLIMTTFSDYIPNRVTQKTKWLYSWRGYVVEICKDEIWDMMRIERKDRELPVDLTIYEPHRVLYKVSVYREAWVNRFAENLTLKIGEAPNWTLRDFLGSDEENARTIMKTAKDFAAILNAKVPHYWDNAGNSLV